MSVRELRTKRFKIMTWNIYFGADLTPLINTTPEQVPGVVTDIFNQVEQTDFPARSKSIAAQICKTKPDLIGLQEVALWTVRSPTTKRVINFLNILLKDLKKLGLNYYVAAVNKNFRSTLPSSTGDIVGLLDRDVILARKKLALRASNIQSKNFRTNLVVPVGNRPFTVLRGWSSIDLCLAGKKLRLVNTHLEGDSVEVQMAQARELLRGPAATNLPLILIGDFNADAEGSRSATYNMLINAGFTDAWTVAGEGPGFTAFQARDLLNPVSTLSERIDLILFRNHFNVKKIRTVGDQQSDRTPSGLWPSDHAGVEALLAFELLFCRRENEF
ncbi:MAG: endonuclease/exonuclease/phosphatase family protein [Firmicutes bacterium]|nr:endonuclease/exonuclease/phosphatase family protein [Bacillota bacterium]